jgi:hypothetical protein
VYYIEATRAEAILFYFNLSAVSELTFQRDDKKLAAQRLKKLFLSNYKFNIVRTPI